MAESTLRVKTQAEVAGLREYARALSDVRKEMAALRAETGAMRGGGVTAGGNAGGGIPSPFGGGGGGGAPGGPGVPPAPPAGGQPGAAATPPHPPAPPAPNPPSPPPNANMPQGGGGGGFMGAVRTGESFLGRVASTAIGVGLGSSLFELPFKAAQTYFEVSRVVSMLGAKFRETGNDANYFAGRLGYTIAQSAQFAEAYGQGMDRFDRAGFIQSIGAARAFGADPGHMAGTMGMLGRLRGNRPMDEAGMMGVLGMASRTGTDRGRLDEFLGAYQRLSEHQFRVQGRADALGPQAAFALSGAAFGPRVDEQGRTVNDPRAQGAAAADFAERFNGVLTGEGPMKTFMMRAIGFGQTGGPGYIDMRKQLEKGVFDPKNVTAMFGSLQRMGLGRGGMFRALESVAGGKLTAEEIDSLVKKLGTTEGLEQYRSLATSDTKDREAFLSGLSENERSAFEKTGFVGLGGTKVSAGEGRAVELEAMQIAVGKPVAEAIGHLTEAGLNVVDTLQSLFGEGAGEMLVRTAVGVEKMTDQLKQIVEGTTSQRNLGFAAVTTDPLEAYKGAIGSVGAFLPGPAGEFYAGYRDRAATRIATEMQAGSQK